MLSPAALAGTRAVLSRTEGHDEGSRRRGRTADPQKWEYLNMRQANDEKAAEAGDQGWELVAVTSGQAGEPKHFIFKRPKQ